MTFGHDLLMTLNLVFKVLKSSAFHITAHDRNWGWSGGAMVLGKLPVLGRPTIRITVGQGPTAFAVGVGGVVWTFLLSSILSLFFLPLFDID